MGQNRMIECERKFLEEGDISMCRTSQPVALVLKALLRTWFRCAGKYLYFIDGARGEDGPAVCLEIMEFGADGEARSMRSFTGFGEDAAMLSAFYNHFLNARGGEHQRVMTMLCAGITSDEDIRAGLRLKDLDALNNAIEAARCHGFKLHFFVHPNG